VGKRHNKKGIEEVFISPLVRDEYDEYYGIGNYITPGVLAIFADYLREVIGIMRLTHERNRYDKQREQQHRHHPTRWL
jgi:hypothetical protein